MARILCSDIRINTLPCQSHVIHYTSKIWTEE